MKKGTRIALILIALICFGVALSYPVIEYIQKQQNVDDMDMLRARKNAAATTEQAVTETPEAEDEATDAPVSQPEDEGVAETAAPQATDGTPVETAAPDAETAAPAAEDAQATAPVSEDGEKREENQEENQPEATPAVTDKPENTSAEEAPARTESAAMPTLTPSPAPSPTPDRYAFTGAKPWPQVERVPLDESKILPQYQELYALNNDLVGWLTVSDTKIDYPVMQCEDDTYYLSHDFFRKDNKNGLLILDSHCDPFTPSYNLVISGHNRKNNTMFSDLYEYYRDKRHWEAHKTIQFDSLMEERTYVVFAAFFAADYDVDEEGFRYNADIQYNVDMNQWLAEVDDYRLYETGIDVEFGDEVLTLTTCNSMKRKNGRFVVVCRRLRDGEVIE